MKYLKAAISEIVYRSSFVVSIPENIAKSAFTEVVEYTSFFNSFKKNRMELESLKSDYVSNEIIQYENKELKEFENRLKIFQMLIQGRKHREISEDLNVGIATVSRGSSAFEKEKIFQVKSTIIDILKSKK